MDNYLIIGRDPCGNYTIRAEYQGRRYRQMTYVWYRKRDAVKEYREQFGLKHKPFITVDWTKNN